MSTFRGKFVKDYCRIITRTIVAKTHFKLLKQRTLNNKKLIRNYKNKTYLNKMKIVSNCKNN